MRRITVLLLAMALLAGCTGNPPSEESDVPRADPVGSTAVREGDERPFVLPDDLELVAALSGFDACDDYLEHVRNEALEQVTPWGLGGTGWWGTSDMSGRAGMEGAEPAEDSAAGGDSGAPMAAAPEQDVDYSGTNVQEVGVDEPDRVKTDGELLYVVDESSLRVLDITGDEPVELATLPLRDVWDGQLLLDGDHLLLTSSAYAAVPFAGERLMDSFPHPGMNGGITTLARIDVSDPTDPTVEERLTLDGVTLSSRLVDGVARIVVRTEQGINLPWVHPEGSGLRAERSALEANRELIRDSIADDWIPYVIHETADGRSTEGNLLDCDRIAHPQDFAGLGMLSVLTVDLAGGGLLPGGDAVGILSGGDTVYASPDRLYVATTRWVDFERLDDRALTREAEAVTTQIHAFDLTDPTGTEYLASGEVPGRLLSQWALSEHQGRLRVASTTGDSGWAWQGGEPSESVVSVLEVEGRELVTVGEVGGLGVTERIYAVRFLGDVGYVVTFRETDPLYTIDLADPTDPRVVGELKITGYSAYLHPMGDGLLLGVGQDADERGMTKGTQLSLFDVADPADPRRIDQVTLADGTSNVEHDHRAFLHWPATGLTVVPFQRWSYDAASGSEDVESGALTFTVGRDEGIVESPTLSHLPALRRDYLAATDGRPGSDDELRDEQWIHEHAWRGAIDRSVVRGDRLITVSDAGIAVHDLDTLEQTGWYRFGG